MTAAKDQNDRLRDGTLPADPAQGVVPALPPPAVRATVDALSREHAQVGRPMGDLHAEVALLGAILWCGTNQPQLMGAGTVKDLLPSGEPFLESRHRSIYDAILALDGRAIAPEPAAVRSELAARGEDRSVGGIAYLDELVSSAPTANPSRARHYAQTIRDWWVRREAARAALGVHNAARDVATPLDQIAARAHELTVVASRAGAADSAIVPIRQAVTSVIRELSTPEPEGMMTGFEAIDRATGGLFPNEVSVLAARTSAGKSTLAAQLAFGVVEANEKRGDPKIAVLYSSLEMRAKNFVRRVIAGRAGVEAKKIRRRLLNPAEFQRVTQASLSIAALRADFMDAPVQTIVAIDAAAQTLSSRYAREGVKLGLIVVDHIHLLKPALQNDKRTRELQIADISRGLSMLADKYQAHVMVLAQVKRPGERRRFVTPVLEDIAESDQIGRNANVVYFIHRERDERGLFVSGKPALFIGGKTRDDEQFAVKVDFDARFVRFSEHACRDPGCCGEASPPDASGDGVDWQEFYDRE